jgi:hypothetical protein
VQSAHAFLHPCMHSIVPALSGGLCLQSSPFHDGQRSVGKAPADPRGPSPNSSPRSSEACAPNASPLASNSETSSQQADAAGSAPLAVCSRPRREKRRPQWEGEFVSTEAACKQTRADSKRASSSASLPSAFAAVPLGSACVSGGLQRTAAIALPPRPPFTRPPLSASTTAHLRPQCHAPAAAAAMHSALLCCSGTRNINDVSALLADGSVEVRVEWKHADDASSSFSQGDVLVTRCCSANIARVRALLCTCSIVCKRAFVAVHSAW